MSSNHPMLPELGDLLSCATQIPAMISAGCPPDESLLMSGVAMAHCDVRVPFCADPIDFGLALSLYQHEIEMAIKELAVSLDDTPDSNEWIEVSGSLDTAWVVLAQAAGVEVEDPLDPGMMAEAVVDMFDCLPPDLIDQMTRLCEKTRDLDGGELYTSLRAASQMLHEAAGESSNLHFRDTLDVLETLLDVASLPTTDEHN